MSGEALLEMGKEGETARAIRRETLAGDPFDKLCTPGGVHASVGFNVGTQANFGELKISATVRLQCDQNEKVMDKAAEMAFKKTLEYMKDGFAILSGGST
jgi:hypothetical protein